MQKILRTTLLLFTSLVLFSCAVTGENSNTDKYYRGSYTVGFESSAFSPEGSKERWWLSFAENVDRSKLQAVMHRTSPRVYKTYHITVRGKVSQKGNYGHMGVYQRRIIVSEIVDVK